MKKTDVTIRPARMADAGRICSLVNYYAERGKMLHRSLESAYESLRDFHVAQRHGEVVGCVSVSLFWADLAEVKSLAVAPHCRGTGIGGKLLKAAVADARKLGVKKLFALTYERDFFAKQGFEVIQRDTLPEKMWRECIYCPKADACDEIAMMCYLDRRASRAKAPRRRRGGR